MPSAVSVDGPTRVVVTRKAGLPASSRRSTTAVAGTAGVSEVVGEVHENVQQMVVDAAGLAALEADPTVESVHVDHRSAAQMTPSDPCFNGCLPGGQWGAQRIDAPAAWDVTTGSPTVTLAVIDTGVAPVAELAGRVIDGGAFVSGPSTGCASPTTSNDDHGHGTSVASIAAAAGNNGIGIAGVAWKVKILAIKALDCKGTGWDSDIAAAIYKAADMGANVINLSLAGPDPDTTLQQAMAYAKSKGALVVAAAGNSTSTTPASTAPMYPAAYDEAMAVAATDSNNQRAGFSFYGPWVDISAPGVGTIVLTQTGQLASGSGTSFAAPLVAGVAALVESLPGDHSPAAVRAKLVQTSTPLGIAGMGSGLVDANAAVRTCTTPANPVGYRLATTTGQVRAFGQTCWAGDMASARLNAPVVALASTATNAGYWMVGKDGGIFSFGDAAFYGSTGNVRLNAPVISMAATPSGKGYWLVAADGGIFSFGDAAFYGSTGNVRLNAPVIAMSPTPSGHGYWLLASDGGIFSFGDAAFFGSTGAVKLTKPVIAMAPTPDGKGYWLVASDGGIFTFGAALFHGSAGGLGLKVPVTGMVVAPSGGGYWLVASDGGVFAYDAPFLGSGAGQVTGSVVGFA